MRKSLLYHIFGWGGVPKRYAPSLRNEGIVLQDEGIGGSVTLRRFKAPGRYHSWKRSWFTGCIVLTERTLAAFAFTRPLIYVPLDHPNISKLHCATQAEDTLLVEYDASAFHEKWSGRIECRFRTGSARLFLEQLQRYTA